MKSGSGNSCMKRSLPGDMRHGDNISLPDSVIETSKPVKLKDFSEHYRIMSADSDFRFSEEYEELKHVEGKNHVQLLICRSIGPKIDSQISYPMTILELNSNLLTMRKDLIISMLILCLDSIHPGNLLSLKVHCIQPGTIFGAVAGKQIPVPLSC